MIANTQSSIRLLLSYFKAKILFGWEQTFNSWNRQVKHARISFAILNKYTCEIEEAVRRSNNLLKLVANSDIQTNASEDAAEGLIEDSHSYADSMVDQLELLPGFFRGGDSNKLRSDSSDNNNHLVLISWIIRGRQRAVSRGQVSAQPREHFKDLFEHFGLRKTWLIKTQV